jgi:hypothetical protein
MCHPGKAIPAAKLQFVGWIFLDFQRSELRKITNILSSIRHSSQALFHTEEVKLLSMGMDGIFTFMNGEKKGQCAVTQPVKGFGVQYFYGDENFWTRAYVQ